ncbi:unnamed protein product, partial [Candidula unifasciata]
MSTDKGSHVCASSAGLPHLNVESGVVDSRSPNTRPNYSDTTTDSSANTYLNSMLPSLAGDYTSRTRRAECKPSLTNRVSASLVCGQFDPEGMSISYPWRRKCNKKLHRLVYIFVAYTLAILAINGFRFIGVDTATEKSVLSSQTDQVVVDDHLVLERFRRAIVVTDHLHFSKGKLQRVIYNKTCLPRSVENFPANFMTLQDTKDGGVVIHIFLALYMFAALAVVCDDYFVPSLEHICE